MPKYKLTSIYQTVFHRGVIEFSVRQEGTAEHWEIAIDGNLHRRLRIADNALAWRAHGEPVASVSMQRKAHAPLAPSQIEEFLRLVWESKSKPLPEVGKTIVSWVRDRFMLPAVVRDMLADLLQVLDSQEAPPLLVVRHNAHWYPWDYVPLQVPRPSKWSLLGLEFPIARERYSEVESDYTGAGQPHRHSLRSSQTQIRSLLVADAASWAGNNYLSIVQKSLVATTMVPSGEMTFDVLRKEARCFCWYVVVAHLDENGIQTSDGTYLQISWDKLHDLRSLFSERFVILAGCEAASPHAKRPCVEYEPGRWVVLFPSSEDERSLADILMTAGAASIVACVFRLIDKAACRYVSSLICRIVEYHESSPIAVFHLRKRKGGTLQDNPGLAFVCFGNYDESHRCSRPRGCRRM